MKSAILVIEDDPVMIAFLDEYLSNDFTTTVESDAAAALKRLEGKDQPSLVILDLRMPGMDGFSFLKTVRADAAHNRLPILVLSGSDRSDDRVRTFDLGADDFMVKPFNPLELTARVRNLIRRSAG